MPNRLRALLRSGVTAYGLWVTVESAAVSEAAAELGFDWICVDMEHGHLSYRDAIGHARAVRGSDTTMLARVPTIAPDAVKRVLDLGLDGVLLPLPHGRDDVARGMSYAKYPPAGVRGVGGERAVRWGLQQQEYLQAANDEVMVIPLIETTGAAAHIEEILAIPRLDAIYFGPADLSADAGYLGQWEGPGIAREILRIRDLAAARGIAAGVNGRGPDDARRRRDEGFGMVGLGSEMGLLLRQASDQLRQLRGTAPTSEWI
ncbi:MAG TPA: aldolase/citrate lyase family protein [Thermomicrobiales bacterium]|nr:aldolase/citrate lyase family protein [Thermomicrobiales bacterium]